MRRTMAVFLCGVLVGGLGVGMLVFAAGDPYEYTTLREYACDQIKAGRMRPPDTVVPGQENPCFVRYFRYARWFY